METTLELRCDTRHAQLLLALYVALTAELSASDLTLDLLPEALMYIQDRISDEYVSQKKFNNLNWDESHRTFIREFIGALE